MMDKHLAVPSLMNWLNLLNIIKHYVLHVIAIHHCNVSIFFPVNCVYRGPPPYVVV